MFNRLKVFEGCYYLLRNRQEIIVVNSYHLIRGNLDRERLFKENHPFYSEEQSGFTDSGLAFILGWKADGSVPVDPGKIVGFLLKPSVFHKITTEARR